jgi:hypothetical protein
VQKVSHIRTAHSMAVDWLGRKLYVLNSNWNIITVIDIDSGRRVMSWESRRRGVAWQCPSSLLVMDGMLVVGDNRDDGSLQLHARLHCRRCRGRVVICVGLFFAV